MAQYGKSEYWEERYTRDPEPFDWYQRWAGLKDTFLEYCQTHMKILMLGSGNSRLSEEMYEEGFHNVTNIDIVVLTSASLLTLSVQTSGNPTQAGPTKRRDGGLQPQVKKRVRKVVTAPLG